MKAKLLLYILLIVAFGSCRNTKEVIRQDSTFRQKTVKHQKIDTDVKVRTITTEKKVFYPGERVFVKLNANCDSIAGLQKEGSVQIRYKTKHDTLLIECLIDSFAVYEHMKKQIVDSTMASSENITTKEKTVTKFNRILKKVNSWHSFFHFLIFAAFILIAAFLIKIIKRFWNLF